VPADLVLRNPGFRPEMMGRRVPHGIYVQIAGIDLVRIDADDFYVLEDNARTPSGVSYMLENREVMMRLVPRPVRRASRRAGRELSRPPAGDAALGRPAVRRRRPEIVAADAGAFNSAYYEHSFLADKLGVELVEGATCSCATTWSTCARPQGPKRVDVIYRRIDDDFLDPLAFRPDSMLGVPGLMGAYLAGNVTLANAVGTGVADDKAVYTYMPEIIRFFPARSRS
jgi:uncharacterized circularly permuted ATP-grasp superfamily protein